MFCNLTCLHLYWELENIFEQFLFPDLLYIICGPLLTLIGKIRKSIYACQAKSNRDLGFASVGAFGPRDPEEAGAERRRWRLGCLGDTAPWQDRCTAPSAPRKLAGRGAGTWRQTDQGTIPGRMAVPEHPTDGDSKPRAGDWEADLVIGYGHGGATVTPT